MSLRDEWLADPEPVPYVEWLRRRTVPAGLLTLQTPEVNRAEQEKAERKPSAYKRKSRANPNGRSPVHGSSHGFKRHVEAGEDPCEACVAGCQADKDRWAAAKREQRARAGAGPQRVAECGTPYMARKHRERGEVVCPACRQAERDEWRRRNPPKEKAA